MTYAVNQTFFSTWGPDMAYVLGFWFADGWMAQPGRDLHIGFVSKDREHLQHIQTAMASEQRLVLRKDGCSTFRVGNRQIWHDLYRLGGRPAKSLIAEVPFVPQEVVHHFVRGFADGDGCLYWDTGQQRAKPRLNLFGGQRFLQQLALMIDRETGVGIVPVRVHGKKVLVLSYPGIRAKVLAKWMYTPGQVPPS